MCNITNQITINLLWQSTNQDSGSSGLWLSEIPKFKGRCLLIRREFPRVLDSVILSLRLITCTYAILKATTDLKWPDWVFERWPQWGWGILVMCLFTVVKKVRWSSCCQKVRSSSMLSEGEVEFTVVKRLGQRHEFHHPHGCSQHSGQGRAGLLLFATICY